MADETQKTGLAPEVVASFHSKRSGLDYTDVATLIRALRAGKSWSEAKALLASQIEDAALDAWRDEALRRAGKAPAAPEPKPAPAPAPAPHPRKKGRS